MFHVSMLRKYIPDPSHVLISCFLSHSRQLLDSYFDPSRNFLDARQLLNNYLNPSRSFSLKHAFLILDRSRYFSIYQETGIPVNRVRAMFSPFLPDLSRQKTSFHLPKHLSLTLNHFPTLSSISRSLPSSSMILFHSFLMHFIFCDLTFGGCWKIWGFSSLMRFAKFLVWFFLNDFKSSCIASHVHFNYDSCILDV